uniref:Tetracycline resistance MFS efflux pump n=1 Tax=Thermosporothrix sp. COM3 TaxID=2490863 RepID=A0A455SHB1_9CHLR|nr:tetracycline resistance MFS efflux pump [Thermosporothrix sp. COM3]
MHITEPEKHVEGARSAPAGGVQPQRRMIAALILLSCCVGLIMTGFGIIVPIFPRRLEALGLGAETLALMEGAFGLGMFLFSTPMGVLADRIGRKPLILLALVGFIVTNVVLTIVNTAALFVLVRFVEGVLVAGLMPASSAVIGDAVPVERQGRWIGVVTTAQASGIALGPGIGGFLYQAWGFSSPFLLSAGFALIASILALILLPETLPASIREQARQRGFRGNRGQQLPNTQKTTGLYWTFLPLLLIDLGVTFIYPFVLPQYPFYFEKILGYSAAEYGIIISAYGAALAVFPLLLGRITDMFPKKHLIIVGCLCLIALNAGMLWLHNYILLIIASVITGLGSALLTPALSTIYLGATNDHNRSQVMGIRGTAISLAVLAAPLTQALVGAWILPSVTFAIGCTLALIMAILVLVALRTPRREVTPASS